MEAAPFEGDTPAFERARARHDAENRWLVREFGEVFPRLFQGGRAALRLGPEANLLASGIAGLSPLATDHIAPRTVGSDDDVVPIEELLFRGPDALKRAIGLGDELRRSAAAPDPAILSELYDLLQLAAAE